MAIRTEARTSAQPTSLSSGVFAQSLWWLAGGATLQSRGRNDLDRPTPGASVTTPEQIRSLEQVRDVVSGLVALKLPPRQDDELRYRWIDTALQGMQYRELARSERGLVLNYLQRLTGYSRAQVNRLVARWMSGQALAKQHGRPEHAFERRYQAADIALLAEDGRRARPPAWRGDRQRVAPPARPVRRWPPGLAGIDLGVAAVPAAPQPRVPGRGGAQRRPGAAASPPGGGAAYAAAGPRAWPPARRKRGRRRCARFMAGLRGRCRHPLARAGRLALERRRRLHAEAGIGATDAATSIPAVGVCGRRRR
jgi:hypothetical protein